MEIGFHTRFSALERERFLASLDPDRALAAFVDGELVGTLLSQVVGLTVPGPSVVASAAVSEVAVLPTHRRRGHLSAMMRRYLDDARERGEAITVLSASEGGIYGRFGFGPATWASRYAIEHPQSRLGAAPDPPGSVRLLSVEEARSCAPAVFDAARRVGVGEVERLEGFWEDLFEPLERPGSADGAHVACYEEDGQVDGYVLYRVEPSAARAQEREIVVTELVSTTPEAYRALWSYALGIDLVRSVRTEERPVDEALRHLLVDPRSLSTLEVIDGNWLRLVDAARALGIRRYAGEGELVIELADEWCPWNSGRFLLEVDGAGRAEVSATKRVAAIALGASELAACYLGGTSLAALAAAGRVLESNPGAARGADALFATSPAPFCSSVL